MVGACLKYSGTSKEATGLQWRGREGELKMLSEITLGVGQTLQDFVGMMRASGLYSECDGALWSFEQRRNALLT